ncbi:MAG: sialidase family protein, partial [Gammaproteobacteria bacterium]
MIAFILLAFALGLNKSRSYTRPSHFLPSRSAKLVSNKPYFHSALASSGITRMVHASSIVELADGTLRAFWFAGSREGGADVEIHSTLFNPKEH